VHIDVWIGRTLLGRYEKTATSWLGNFASGNIRHDHITAGGLLEKSGMVFGIIAGDIYAYTGLEDKGKHKNRKSEFPFVPFLLGAHLVMWGIQR